MAGRADSADTPGVGTRGPPADTDPAVAAGSPGPLGAAGGRRRCPARRARGRGDHHGDLVATAAPSERPGAPARDTGPVVLVLDPRVPGFRADSPLGSVLGPPGADQELQSLVRARMDAGAVEPALDTPAEAFRRTDLDRDWLSAVLRKGARRLLYVGHVSGAPVDGGQSEDGSLHLCCGPESTGLAAPVRTHRPLSAKDLLLGTLPLRADGEPGGRIWPAPRGSP